MNLTVKMNSIPQNGAALRNENFCALVFMMVADLMAWAHMENSLFPENYTPRI